MTAVVIMAGGKGKRLRPFTNDTPKPMLSVNGKPMLEWVIKRFVDQGFKDIYISVGYLGKKIEEYFKDGADFGCSIKYLREEEPLGTAGSIALLPAQDESFIVVNGDVLTSVNYNDLIRYHAHKECIATIGATTHKVEIPFGVLNMSNYTLTGFDEKPTYTYPIAAGIYVFRPNVIDIIMQLRFVLHEIDMPHLINTLYDSDNRVSVFPISGYWQDVGRPEDLALVNNHVHA